MIHNPYWDEVKPYVGPAYFGGDGLEVTAEEIEGYPGGFLQFRDHLVSRFAWTITDPATVQFVAVQAGRQVLDPLAGTGYWGYLLSQYGIEVRCFDIHPPRKDTDHNHYHQFVDTWMPVGQADGLRVTAAIPRPWTLLLSWPPMYDPIGYDCLKAYRGDRVIFIGEGASGATGTDELHDELEKNWEPIKYHRPVQFFAMHDYVFVFERRNQIATGS